MRIRAQQTMMAIPYDFRLEVQTGTDWERDERERKRHDEIMERIARAQMALPIIGPSVEVTP